MTRSEAISRGQQARHAARITMEGDELPERKKCTQVTCDRAGEWLPASEFYVVKRKLLGGGVRRYLKAACKRCENERKRAWKQRVIEEEGQDAWSKRIKAWNVSRTPEYRKAYNRQWWRRTHGKGVKVWKIYAHEVYGGPVEQDIFVESEPFRLWLETHLDPTVSKYALEEAAEVPRDLLTSVMRGKQTTLRLEYVDSILLQLGRQLELTAIYPLEEA